MNKQKDISRKDATLIREHLLNEANLKEQEKIHTIIYNYFLSL